MKIKRIPIILNKLKSSLKTKKPNKVPTKGSTVTRIAAFEVSNPPKPKVYKTQGRNVHKNAIPKIYISECLSIEENNVIGFEIGPKNKLAKKKV